MQNWAIYPELRPSQVGEFEVARGGGIWVANGGRVHKSITAAFLNASERTGVTALLTTRILDSGNNSSSHFVNVSRPGYPNALMVLAMQ